MYVETEKALSVVQTYDHGTRLAHLVSQFACNTRVIIDASSSPSISCVKITVTKT